MTPILKITDGTNQVNLLALGVSVEGWRQAVNQYKGSGTWQASSLADGRRLVDKQFAAAIETYPIATIGESGNTQDITISILHRLFALMEKASNYWVDKWRNEPVRIECRADCETNTRYAIVHTANIPQIANLYAPSAFPGDAILADMSLVIERGQWSETAPGTGTAVELSVVEPYNGRDLGNVDSAGARDPTTAINEVFAYNGAKIANLTHIYWHNVTAGTWSANLMTAVLPFAIAPALAVGETGHVYFGIDSTVADSGPFTSLVFDISPVSVNLNSGIPESYNSVFGWINVVPTTLDSFLAGAWLDNAGIISDHWFPAIGTFGTDDWGTANLFALFGGVAPNVTAFWMRYAISNSSAINPVTPPQQRNRDIYTISWPYVDLQADQSIGDIKSLQRLVIRGETGEGVAVDGGVSTDVYAAQTSRIFVASRQIERGSLFSAYINAADEQNPAGITVATGGASAVIASALAPSGRMIQYTSAGAGFVYTWRFSFSAALIDEYRGKYRMFVRARTSDATPSDSSIRAVGAITVPAGVGTDTPILWQTDEVALSATITDTFSRFELIDLGEIELPAPVKTLLPSETGGAFMVAIHASAANLETITFMDVILMPIDEWAFETLEYRNQIASSNRRPLQLFKGSIDYDVDTRYMDIDASLIVPKEYTRSNLKLSADDSFVTNWLSVKNKLPGISPNGKAQRVWFLAAVETDDGVWISSYDPAFTISLTRNAQYLGPRGAA